MTTITTGGSIVRNFTGSKIAPGNYTTAMGQAAFATQPATPFAQLPPGLQGMHTRMVYIDPSNNLHNLAGPNKGLEGARISSAVFGDQQWHFSQVLTNSPYIYGATIERQNIPERKITFGITIGSQAPPMTEYQYRMAEDYWWAGQDETQDGWLGVYTRFSGWRWIPVRPDETVKTPQKADATAFGNNSAQYDITWVASRPYFTKPARYRIWQAANAGPATPPPADLVTGITPGLVTNRYYSGVLHIANAGDLPSYAQFYVSSPGQAVLQDNNSTRLVPMPETNADVGTYWVNTEPGQRTLTAANDPLDNLIYDYIRQSTILNYFLSGISSEGVALQLQFQNRFVFPIPPQTEVAFTVAHSNPKGVITVMVPQRYRRSR